MKNGIQEYLRNIQIQSLDKTEKQTIGVISEPISINCTSLWYQEAVNIFNMTPSSENEVRWDIKWDSIWADYSSRNVNYINKSHTEAPILVEIDGEVENPKISLYVEGKLYQELSFKVRIEKYEKFLYGTEDNDFYIKKQNTDGTMKDLYNFDTISEDDFANKNMCIVIPTNKSCEIKLEADTTIQNAKITILPQYKVI